MALFPTTPVVGLQNPEILESDSAAQALFLDFPGQFLVNYLLEDCVRLGADHHQPVDEKGGGGANVNTNGNIDIVFHDTFITVFRDAGIEHIEV
jgi:hypothetical protein